MSSGKDVAEFPGVEAKLQKANRKSAFEKQKAEAEAKRQREAAETAAVYEDFVKSFDREDGNDGSRPPNSFAPSRSRPGFGGAPQPPISAPGASRRHFGTSGLKSGPGSLGMPPAPFGKKRSFQDFSKSAKDRPLLGFDEREGGGGGGGSSMSVPKAFDASDDEEMGDAVGRAQEKAVSRPTLRLSNLPPGTSPAMVKALIPNNLTVENVKILPSSGSGGPERKCTTAIVTLSPETPANDMDAAVSSLQGRYMGYGYHLSLHRHLSSAVASSVALPNPGSLSSGSHPFGAKPVEQPAGPGPSGPSSHHGFNRGFAPPPSYAQGLAGVNRSNLLCVPVKPPHDVRTIQLINKLIEGVLEHGPEFEALLMSRPEVQREEKWAWLWDARSEGGIWYRWTLWGVVTGAHSGLKKGKYLPLFDGSHAWKTPEKRLPYEYTTRLDEFISDSDYNSSDDEDMDGDGNHENKGGEDEKTFLNPLEKAKLAHLLARLPTTLSKLRKGDIARVTTFAIMHASRGVDEVVDMILSNVEKPFSLTGVNPQRRQDGKEQHGAAAGTEESTSAEGPDVSAASLVGLYAVSDILSSSSTSGVRHAWRFRQLFETAIRDRKIFEHLGMMAERLGWGRLRAEKWKRSVNLVLNLWEGWCVFPAESQALFSSTFENPPSLKTEEKADDNSKKGKWKVVEATSLAESKAMAGHRSADDIEGEPIKDDDVEGEPVGEDDIEGEPIEEDDVEGEPIEEDDVAGEPIEEDDVEGEPMDDAELKEPEDVDMNDSRGTDEHSGRVAPRRRMRAADMFADSDDSDGGVK